MLFCAAKKLNITVTLRKNQKSDYTWICRPSNCKRVRNMANVKVRREKSDVRRKKLSPSGAHLSQRNIIRQHEEHEIRSNKELNIHGERCIRMETRW